MDQEDIIWVIDKPGLKRLIARIRANDLVVFDLETTGLDEFAYDDGPWNKGIGARVTMASFTFGPEGDSWVLPLSHVNSVWKSVWQKLFGLVMKEVIGKQLVGHNVKFDARYTHAMSAIDLSKYLHWDTMIGAHLLDEISSKKLKERVPKVFGVERWDDFDLSRPGASEVAPFEEFGLYAARDTYWTWRLYVYQQERMFLGTDSQPQFPDEVEDARLGQVAMRISMPKLRSITRMEIRGIKLDQTWTAEQLSWEKLYKRIGIEEMQDINPFEGKASIAPTSNWFKGWADKAIDSGKLRLGGMTPKGNKKWSRDVLSKQKRDGYGLASIILDTRSHSKKAEFLQSWINHCRPDGAIHASYNLATVITGRLSSSQPNMQQVTKSLLAAFVPRENFFMANLDYSQIEMRVAAILSGSVPMIEAYQNELDLHLQLAGRVNGNATIRAAKMYLMWLGLPPNGTGAEVLLRLRKRTGKRGFEKECLQVSGALGKDQESGSRERWLAGRGIQQSMEGREFSLALSEVPEGLLRELRSDFERLGWPWEWDADDAGRTSFGSQSLEQQSLKLNDAVQVVSSTSASRLKSLTGDDWGKMRQSGKAGDFGLLYGMGPVGLMVYAEEAYGVYFSMEEANAVYEAFFETWTGLRRWHKRQILQAKNTGQVVSPIGRVRRLPDIFSPNPKLAAHAERNAINSPVQGMASDLMQLAIAKIEGMAGEKRIPSVYAVATVHDSVVLEVPIRHWEEAVMACEEIMINGVVETIESLGCEMTVPLAVESQVGTRWGMNDIAMRS